MNFSVTLDFMINPSLGSSSSPAEGVFARKQAKYCFCGLAGEISELGEFGKRGNRVQAMSGSSCIRKGAEERSGAQRGNAAASRGVGSCWGLARDSGHYTHAPQEGPGCMALAPIPISPGLNTPRGRKS